MNDKLSNPLKITSGVPQGSTLGPTLFLIYVNELLQLKLSGRIYSFADDTSILFSAKTENELLSKITTDLNIITNWFWHHKLYPNLDKTKLLLYGNQKNNLNQTIKLYTNPYCLKTCNCNYLTQVTQTKYLGLILDQKLNWEPHTLHLQKKLRKLNYLLYHTSKLFSRTHLLRVYRALYEPVLILSYLFCLSVYSFLIYF